MTLPTPEQLSSALDNLYTDAVNGSKLYQDPPADVVLRNGDAVPNLRKRLQEVTAAADQLGALDTAVTIATTASGSATTSATAASASANAASLYPFVGRNSLADLLADTSLTLTPGGAGSVVEGQPVMLRTGGNLIVAPATETEPHVETVGGLKLYINSNRHDILASTFLIATDADDEDIAEANWTRGQLVINRLAADGGGRIVFDTETRIPLLGPLALRSGVSLEGRGTLLENLRPAYVSGQVGADAVIFMGSGALQDDDDHTWVAIKAATVGQGYIEAVSGSTAWTSVGREIAFCAATAATFGSGLKQYDAHHIRVVRAIYGGKVWLDRPVTEEIALDGSGTIGSSVVVGSGWAADVSFANASAKGASLVANAPRHAISNATFCDFLIRARSGNPFARQMMHDCLIDSVTVVPSDTAAGAYGLGGNFFSHSLIRNWRAAAWTRLLEIAGMSKFSKFEDLALHNYAPPGVTMPAMETQLRIAGEASVGITVRGLNANCGQMTSAQDVVKFSGGRDCSLLDSYVYAKDGGGGLSFDGNEVGHRIAGLTLRGAYAVPVNLKGTGIVIEGSDINATASSGKAVKVLTGASGCVVRDCNLNGGIIRFDGAPGAQPNKVYDNSNVGSIEYAADGDAYDNSTTGLSAARAALAPQVSTNGQTNATTTAADLMTAVTIAAGSITTGDALVLRAAGTKTATAGNTSSGELTLTATVNSTTYTLASWTFGEAATSCDWLLEAEVLLMGTTQYEVKARLTTETVKAVVPSGSTLTLSGGSLSLGSDGAKTVQPGSTLVLSADLPVTVSGGGVRFTETRQTGVSDMTANAITLSLKGRVTVADHSDTIMRRVAEVRIEPSRGMR